MSNKKGLAGFGKVANTDKNKNTNTNTNNETDNNTESKNNKNVKDNSNISFKSSTNNNSKSNSSTENKTNESVNTNTNDNNETSSNTNNIESIVSAVTGKEKPVKKRQVSIHLDEDIAKEFEKFGKKHGKGARSNLVNEFLKSVFKS
ncbi:MULTISPECIES: hypothetical protein [Halobacillus]|uniref:hypothetical protein n=1 Tax=Halobacillus TaxID=45667 RepID=UPI0009A5A41D|nr:MULTISPECIES: hypothetical protein [Halobacillus]